MASSPPRRFVRRAPSRMNPNRSVDIRVTDMAAGDALWWDRKFGPHHARDRKRADRFWAWSVLLPMCHLVQLTKRRYCRPLVIWARADNRRFVRAGMCAGRCRSGGNPGSGSLVCGAQRAYDHCDDSQSDPKL